MIYEELPDDLKKMLFEPHTHAMHVAGEDIVYTEKDVLNIIEHLLTKKPIRSLFRIINYKLISLYQPLNSDLNHKC